MNWFWDLLYKESVAHTVIMLCMAVFPGLWIGKISFGGIKLGIAGVLFSGLLVGALGFPLDSHVIHFVREWGLILFVFAVGLQVGPGFFANFRDRGLIWNAYAGSIVLLGILVAWIELRLFGLPVEAIVGIMSGAVTNTPGLGAAQQALKEVPLLGEQAVVASGTGYAVAYPFGIFGIIITMLLIRWFFRVRIDDEALRQQSESKQTDGELRTFTVQLRNPLMVGKSLSEALALAGSHIAVSRLGRSGKIVVPSDNTILEADDLLHVVCPQDELEKVTAILGNPSDQDLRWGRTEVTARRILVSSVASITQTVAQLRFSERHSVRLTRVRRSGIDFVPDGKTLLHKGDEITAVGQPDGLRKLAKELGDSQGALEHPDLLSIFLGILAGVVLGSLPIALPGLPAPVKLGLAGGPLLVALLMGYKRSLGPLHFHLPPTATVFMKELGILLFLAAVGLGSGPNFVKALSDGSGWHWMGCGVAITLIPILLVGFVARWKGKLNYLSLCGLLAGSMTDPPALGYANALHSGPAQSLAYASVYPFTMFLRVLGAQVFVILLAG